MTDFKDLLNGKEYLINDRLLSCDYNKVKKILEMEEWNDKRFAQMLGPTIWYRSYDEIKKVLNMEEWNNPKYFSLLTSNIWHSNYENIKSILELEEWQDERFKKLLTSNIWKNRYDTIVIKLNLPYWNKEEYTHLLVPSLFTLPINNIIYGIELFEENGIGEYVTNKALRHNLEKLKKIFAYMKEHNFELLLSTKETKKLVLNPIFSMPNTELKKERVL